MSYMSTKWSLFLFLVVICLTQTDCHFKRVCYLRVDQSQRIDVHLIDGNLCTHIILGFAVVVNGTIGPNRAQDVNYYQNVTQLKHYFPDLKVMLSVGGGGSDGSGFHEMCANQSNIDR
jgi:hypothetical protein